MAKLTYIKNLLSVRGGMKQWKEEHGEDAHWKDVLRIKALWDISQHWNLSSRFPLML